MPIGPYSTEIYDDILSSLGLKKMTIEHKYKRLQRTLPLNKKEKLKDDVNNCYLTSSTKEHVIKKYIKYNGTPFFMKSRKLDLERYYEGPPKETYIKHMGLFFNKNDSIYHYIPFGVKYGKQEYDKEYNNLDWKFCKENKKGAFFTIRTIKEINAFAKKWDKVYKNYEYQTDPSKIFAYTLLYWLL